MTRRLFAGWTRNLLIAVALFALPAPALAQPTLPRPNVQVGPRGITVTPMPGVTPAVEIPNSIYRALRQPGNALPPPYRTAPPPGSMAPGSMRPQPTPAPVAPIPTPPSPQTPAIAPSNHSVGRTFGIFVGITHYGNRSDLPFCADDARRMQTAFVRSGAMSPADSVVLTDAQASSSAVLGAIQRTQARMGPSDTLVFFFSGHGGRVSDQNGDEADGTDETIVLIDRAITDDDFQAALARGQGRDFVALDSCYSGGFSRDIARLPNSVGFYASAENEVAYVANEYRAGGYLSYFLAQNITRMGSRSIPMWELSRDLRSDFRQSGADRRQALTLGISHSVNSQTVLLTPATPAGAMLARR